MAKLSASILSADFSRLGEEVMAVGHAGADMLHLDVMDGCFVSNISFGPGVISSVRALTQMPFDVHLMINEPERYIDDFLRAGADLITVHAESTVHLHRAIWQIKNGGKKAGVALNPATNLNMAEPILQDIDLLLIMSVNPGFGGQSYIESSTKKIMAAKQMICEKGYSTLIEVDGGVNLQNCRTVAQAGADCLIAGSAIFSQQNYSDAVRAIKAASEAIEC